MGGAILTFAGLLRLGGLIRLVPHPVLLGFTAAIAVIILVSQLRDLFGLTISGREPAALLPKLSALAQAWPTVNIAAACLALGVIGVILALRRFSPRAPGMLVAVVMAAFVTVALSLSVETIGTRFGGIPDGLLAPGLPPFTTEKVLAVLPDALVIAFLAGIESVSYTHLTLPTNREG